MLPPQKIKIHTSIYYIAYCLFNLEGVYERLSLGYDVSYKTKYGLKAKAIYDGVRMISVRENGLFNFKAKY